MSEDITTQQINDIESHLRTRGVDPSQIKVIMDKQNNMATFLLYNLSGQLIGYQRYNPNGNKKEHGDTLAAKYFTWVTKESPATSKLAVWGVENIDKNNPNLYVAEGIFDAVKLKNAGLPAIAVLTNNPKLLKSWFTILNKHTVSITDNDDAGRKLGNITDETYPVPAGLHTEQGTPVKDLGDMSQSQVNKFLSDIGHLNSSTPVPSNSQIEVRPVQSKEEMEVAKDHILNQHYIRRWPKAVQAVLGIFKNGRQIGTLLYGIGTRAQSAREIFQHEDGTPVMQNNQMWELQRSFTTEEAKKEIPNLGSMSISRGNEWVRQHAKTKDGKPVKVIISYADSSAGHKGSVYQSTNATYLGEQRPLPFYVITNPANGNYERRSILNKKEHDILVGKGFTVEKMLPPAGKHKFIYALGKDQAERDKMLSHIVKPIFDYPKENEAPREIPNPAKERAAKKTPTQNQPTQTAPESKRATIKKLLNSKVKNPETGNDILVRTALKYDKNHPSYKQAKGMTDAWSKRYGIKVRDTR